LKQKGDKMDRKLALALLALSLIMALLVAGYQGGQTSLCPDNLR
jgi:hypothetical protein